MQHSIRYSEERDLPMDQVVDLYRANGWSAAEKPDLLAKALQHSHAVIAAWDGNKLIGLGNAITDGYLVVYYPHLLVLPEYQGKGIGTTMMKFLLKKYEGFHQHMIVADADAATLYQKCGFERAGRTEPMWIYPGNDH